MLFVIVPWKEEHTEIRGFEELEEVRKLLNIEILRKWSPRYCSSYFFWPVYTTLFCIMEDLGD